MAVKKSDLIRPVLIQAKRSGKILFYDRIRRLEHGKRIKSTITRTESCQEPIWVSSETYEELDRLYDISLIDTADEPFNRADSQSD